MNTKGEGAEPEFVHMLLVAFSRQCVAPWVEGQHPPSFAIQVFVWPAILPGGFP
ncbi:MAG: hypothetical protein CM1200mP4_4300 [Rhodospirillaceae bacterium]|nr:MAG: hypothetical protein CM1200mP4_4300 [Rhodospirillaceae bacterium]